MGAPPRPWRKWPLAQEASEPGPDPVRGTLSLPQTNGQVTKSTGRHRRPRPGARRCGWTWLRPAVEAFAPSASLEHRPRTPRQEGSLVNTLRCESGSIELRLWKIPSLLEVRAEEFKQETICSQITQGALGVRGADKTGRPRGGDGQAGSGLPGLPCLRNCFWVQAGVSELKAEQTEQKTGGGPRHRRRVSPHFPGDSRAPSCTCRPRRREKRSPVWGPGGS